jgi:hypothetical protein
VHTIQRKFLNDFKLCKLFTRNFKKLEGFGGEIPQFRRFASRKIRAKHLKLLVGTNLELEFDHRKIGASTMPTNTYPNHRFATMTPTQLMAEHDAMVARWQAEDIARRERNAAILAALDVR